MALFIDGPACTISDLVEEDSGLLDTAASVGINVSSKLRLAMEEVQTELENWFQRPLAGSGPGTAGGNQTATVGQVVVTRELARWEKMQALAMVYRDAYFSQLVDRYQGKWDEYDRLTQHARDQFVAIGVGLVADPMPRAPLPVLGTVAAGSLVAAGTFYACVTWVNAAGQEGAASQVASIVVPAEQLMTVMVADAPANAVGFNVYAGTVLAMLTLQNTGPIQTGNSFTVVPGVATSSQIAGNGQAPDYVKAIPRMIPRG